MINHPLTFTNGPQIVLETGDITMFAGDCVVNACNQWLVPGGGVDGALRDASKSVHIATSWRKGEKWEYPISQDNGQNTLEKQCNAIGYLPYGYVARLDVPQDSNLAFKHMLMLSAPPFERSRPEQCARLTREAYLQAFSIAENVGAKNIYIPAVGTGVYNVPVVQAAQWAVDSLQAHEWASIKHVHFVLYDLIAFHVYNSVFSLALES